MRPPVPLNTRPLNARAAAPPSHALLRTPRCVARFQIKTKTAAYKSPRAIPPPSPVFLRSFFLPTRAHRTALHPARPHAKKTPTSPRPLQTSTRANTLPTSVVPSHKNHCQLSQKSPVLFRARSRPYLVCCCVNGAAAFLSLFLYGNCVQVALLRGIRS